jgi:hypothetical protein
MSQELCAHDQQSILLFKAVHEQLSLPSKEEKYPGEQLWQGRELRANPSELHVPAEHEEGFRHCHDRLQNLNQQNLD